VVFLLFASLFGFSLCYDYFFDCGVIVTLTSGRVGGLLSGGLLSAGVLTGGLFSDLGSVVP